MNPKYRRFAPLGLVVALIAALVAIGLYIVQRELNLPLQISLGLVVIGLMAYAALNPEQVRTALTGRQARYGSNALVLAVAFLGIIVVVNYFFHENSKRWDLTEDQENTLAPETLEILTSLPEQVTARAFYSPQLSRQSAEELLEQYAFNSDNFNYEFIDPVKDPTAAQEAEVTKDGTIVLYMGEHKEPVEFVSEQEITAALVRLMNPGGRVVYFLTGHGEFPLEGGGEQTYTQLVSLLESKNYAAESLNLLTTNNIPEDASVIVIAGPVKPVTQVEVDLLDEYLQNGGSLIVLQDPPVFTEFGSDPDPLADYLAANFGIIYGNDVVVDVDAARAINQPFVAIANQYANHIITERMRGLATFFPTARSLTIDNSIETGVSQIQLIQTSPNSWAETNAETLGTSDMEFEESEDTLGPITLAVVSENFSTGARLVVFGDSEYASNGYFAVYGNGDMIVNSIDWAARQENLISLTPKTTTERVLVPPKAYTLNLILLGAMVVLPGLVVASGIVAWVVRRRRG